MKTKDPIEWAKQLKQRHGNKDARRIACINSSTHFGTDQSIKNKDFVFYDNANRWLKKHAPVSEDTV